jgi:glycosyltransferase involved in cell wall biosynthesis
MTITNKLSIVIPALNEPYLKILLTKIDLVLDRCISVDGWEIIVRDDKGCGNAIIRGIEEAKYNIICVMDGDGSHNPEYITGMFHYITKENYDIVYGRKSKSFDSLYRKFITKTFDWIVRMFVKPLPDLMSGFFMFSTKNILNYPDIIEHPKVLMKIIMMNPELRINSIPITFEKRKQGKSKLGNRKVAYEILKEIYHYAI